MMVALLLWINACMGPPQEKELVLLVFWRACSLLICSVIILVVMGNVLVWVMIISLSLRPMNSILQIYAEILLFCMSNRLLAVKLISTVLLLCQLHLQPFAVSIPFWPQGNTSQALVEIAMSGPSQRLAEFFLGLLKPATVARYIAAKAKFDAKLAELNIGDWYSLLEERQDFWLADLLLEFRDEDPGFSVANANDMVASLQKFYLSRRRYKASFAVIAGWQVLSPPVSAPPVPDVALYAWCTLMVAAKRTQLAMLALCCFCGLLRIGEGLQLRWSDVILPSTHRSGNFVVLMLRFTKRGVPDSQKVFLTEPTLVSLFERYAKLHYTADHMPFLATSYATFCKWWERGLTHLGFPARMFRSHSLRRGGATALALSGWSIAQICMAGRWMHEATARLYIMRGEVVLLRARRSILEEEWNKLVQLASLLTVVFGKL